MAHRQVAALRLAFTATGDSGEETSAKACLHAFLIQSMCPADVIPDHQKMRSCGIRRLPVVNDRGGLEGILSFDDLIDLVAEELSDLSTLVSREQKRERETKSSF